MKTISLAEFIERAEEGDTILNLEGMSATYESKLDDCGPQNVTLKRLAPSDEEYTSSTPKHQWEKVSVITTGGVHHDVTIANVTIEDPAIIASLG